MMAELLNMSVKAMCDYSQIGPDKKFGIIKDIAAAGISIKVWALFGGYKYSNLWVRFLQ